MVSLILRVLSFFFIPIKNLLIASRSNTRNFAIFVVSVAVMNVVVRSVLILTFSTPQNARLVYILTSLIAFTSWSVLFSVFIFYVRLNYPRFLKHVFGAWIDFERLDQNKNRREGFAQKLQIDFPDIIFDLRLFLYPIAIMWTLFSVNSALKIYPIWLQTLLGFLLWISCVLFILYLRWIRKTILKHAEIPIELLYVPSKPEKLWWDLKFVSWEALQDFLFGQNRNRRSQSGAEYYRRRLKTTKNYNSFARVVGGIVVLSTVIGTTLSVESSLYHPQIPPSAQLASSLMWGYYSSKPETVDQALTLVTYGCDMSTFCYPGTKKLDSGEVVKAYDYYQEMRSQRKYMGHDYDYLQGPYNKLSIVDGKESAFVQSDTASDVQGKERLSIE